MSDADRTKTRILEAATQEFAQEGFAGARVDAVARLAGANKQLIYHYYGDKEGLFRAVMLKVLNDRIPVDVTSRSDFAEQCLDAYRDFAKRRTWIRLLMWESLSFEERPVVGEEERMAHGRNLISLVKRLQERRIIDPAFCTGHVMVALFSMLIVPWVFPQLVRHLTGCAPSDPEFRKDYANTLHALLRRFAPMDPQGDPPG